MTEVNELNYLMIRGAREHNLKEIDLDIPKRSLVVLSGVSGSGKSSLAFDTIFAEGQRRYVESLSSYARQFLGQMEKPKYDTIRGLSPTIAIEQKSAGRNPRSTVGTITEIYDYLRVLYARIGVQFCHHCGKKVGRSDAATMVQQLLEIPVATKILLLAPVVENRKGEYRQFFTELQQEGFVRVRVDGTVYEIEEIPSLAKQRKHNIEVVIDRLTLAATAAFRSHLADSVETALHIGNGHIIVHIENREDIRMSAARSCCGHAFPQLDPPLFSFNTPHGSCDECAGIGSVLSMDPEKIIPDPTLSIREGAVLPWKNYFVNKEESDQSWGWDILNALQKQFGISWDTPWNRIPKKQRDIILFGTKDNDLKITWKREGGQGHRSMQFEGLVPQLMRRYMATKSDEMKSWYEKYMSEKICSSCEGKRLKPEVLAVKIGTKSIMELCAMTPPEAMTFLAALHLTENEEVIANELLKEILNRLGFLKNVGLDYLTIDRAGGTLSGGESQRIRLASQIGSELTGVIYVLDEPSIGLHQRDNAKLIQTLKRLRDLGNTVLVVEHDRETMEESDWLIDIGPGAGRLGGQVIAQGTPAEVAKNPASVTGRYLADHAGIERPKTLRKVENNPKKFIEVIGAKENNLRIKSIKFPLGVFTCVTGVSGAGKSTLVNQILLPCLARALHGVQVDAGEHERIVGLQNIDKVIEIDQQPIGRTPRSNPATYTKVFDAIRDLFALLPESRMRGYEKGRFSFNVKGGRCEHCEGDGFKRVSMHFLADVFVPCDVCHGKRFNAQTLEVHYKGHSIADILDLTVTEAITLFQAHPKIHAVLETLNAVGLSYLKLGQSATTLSGGEAQRIKLSRELAKRDTGRTLYVLDEPTTGLHFDDIKKLLTVLQRLVDSGNTVIVIEHNLDVIKCADWIIDLGPEGGAKGGRIVVNGTPETVARCTQSFTGQYLAQML